MNFSPRKSRDEPEINLIPFIDVLLVILIFLMLTTTYSKFTELQLTLPVADAQQQRDHPKEIIVAVAADGRYAVNKASIEGGGTSVDALASALREAAKVVNAANVGNAGNASNAGNDSIVVISADATAAHQSVVTVMDAARRVGLSHITFATQSSASAGAGKP